MINEGARSTVNETAGKPSVTYALRLGLRNSGDNSKNNDFCFSCAEGFSVIRQSVFNPEKHESHSGTLMAYCKSLLYILKKLQYNFYTLWNWNGFMLSKQLQTTSYWMAVLYYYIIKEVIYSVRFMSIIGIYGETVKSH